MKKNMIVGLCLAGSVFLAGNAFAHTPLCTCYDNGDGTFTCEGGFSDGSSAAGVSMTVKDADGKVIASGKMDEDSEFSCDRPDKDFTVIFDAGPGHVVKVDGDDIEE